MDVSNQVLIYNPDYIESCIYFYLNSLQLRYAFVIWILRFESIETKDITGLKQALKELLTDEYCNVLISDGDENINNFPIEYDDVKCELTDTDIKNMFIDASKEAMQSTCYSQQQIFYGAPGTGKSHEINRLTEGEDVIRTTFHPDTDYSTFVGCYKPTTKNCSNQSLLDYDSLVDRFKKYISDLGNITHASAAIGYNYHDSIVKMQEGGVHSIADLLADAHKSGTTYDTTIRSGMLLYEEQVQLGRVNSKLTYEFVAQAFTNAYIKAWNTTDDVYLIIEEINRGNCAQIFGDLFQLLDRKNGESEYPVDADTDLANYLRIQLANTCRTDIPKEVKNGKKLKLPSNLYIWATMNTSDQSLFPIDSAFKRRWDWKYLKIKEGKDKNGNKFDWVIDVNLKDENGEERPVKWWAFIKKINEIIASMTSSADKQLGYFFCKADKKQNETDQDATIISEDAFVGKMLFYLWNDVFKDYGFEDATLFRFKSKEEDEEKESDKDLTFPDFYDEEGEKVNSLRVTDFVQKVMNWKKNNEENS